MTWKTRAKQWFIPRPSGPSARTSLTPGMYHFQQERDGQFLRFHLRVEPDGHALLLAGASEAARLPPPAASAVYARLAGKPLREFLPAASPEDARRMLLGFAGFVARLHDRGVYFRSLHLGNAWLALRRIWVGSTTGLNDLSVLVGNNPGLCVDVPGRQTERGTCRILVDNVSLVVCGLANLAGGIGRSLVESNLG